jgi:hypothetical protein
MLNFDQGDLLDAAERAGFEQIHLDLQVRIERPPPMRWEAFLHASGNPRIPTIAEAMDQTLSPAERDRLSGALRRPIEQGIGRRRSALAYLWAVRPSK